MNARCIGAALCSELPQYNTLLFHQHWAPKHAPNLHANGAQGHDSLPCYIWQALLEVSPCHAACCTRCWHSIFHGAHAGLHRLKTAAQAIAGFSLAGKTSLSTAKLQLSARLHELPGSQSHPQPVAQHQRHLQQIPSCLLNSSSSISGVECSSANTSSNNSICSGQSHSTSGSTAASSAEPPRCGSFVSLRVVNGRLVYFNDRGQPATDEEIKAAQARQQRASPANRSVSSVQEQSAQTTNAAAATPGNRAFTDSQPVIELFTDAVDVRPSAGSAEQTTAVSPARAEDTSRRLTSEQQQVSKTAPRRRRRRSSKQLAALNLSDSAAPLPTVQEEDEESSQDDDVAMQQVSLSCLCKAMHPSRC